MEKEILRSEIIGKIYELAFSKANDAISLAFLDEISEKKLRRLELGPLVEMHKLSNGTVDVKLVDRVKLLEMLLSVTQAQEGGEELARAISAAAERVSGEAVENCGAS